MRKEYDLKRLKVKRSGILPALKNQAVSNAKIRITLSLDRDIIDYFKSIAKAPGTLPYQTQINQALRKTMESSHNKNTDEFADLKDALLSDIEFIRKVMKKAQSFNTKK